MEKRWIHAPCGMNCNICSGILRDDPVCGGCSAKGPKPSYCITCMIKACAASTTDGTCATCAKIPCARLRRLDRRYRSRYGMSMLENLAYATEHGMDSWSEREHERWSCVSCGSILSAHKSVCRSCKAANPRFGSLQDAEVSGRP